VVYTDPKHGRWILPLIILGMVILTYTFVNSIEPAESPSGSAPGEPPFTTAPTAPTTTLPPAVAQFLVTLDIFENQARSFASEVNQVNNRWETRENNLATTRTAFLNLQTQLRNFETDVAQAPNVPPELAAGHVELLLQVTDLPVKMEEIILGLDAPDDGTLRRAAVAEFQVEVDQVLAAIDAIRATARGEAEPTTTTLPTDDEGDDTTTTTEATEG
jgi:hypothetical protein